MAKVYIDNDYKCYVSPGEGRREIDAVEFDGYCTEYIEGFRLVPDGETWARDDGEVFEGRMKSPWKPYDKLHIAQLEYELADADEALAILGVTVDD